MKVSHGCGSLNRGAHPTDNKTFMLRRSLRSAEEFSGSNSGRHIEFPRTGLSKGNQRHECGTLSERAANCIKTIKNLGPTQM